MPLQNSSPQKTTIGLATVTFSVLFVAAQALHPDPFATGLPADGLAFAAHINNAFWMHFAHFLEFLCAPLLLVVALHFHALLKPTAPRLAMIAVVMATIGTFMLAGNKAALCFTASAFDTLPDATLMSMAPGFDALLERRGFMAVLWGISLLPLGFVVFAAGLLRARVLPAWQGWATLIGSLMLANPEIQAVNTVASLALALGLGTHGAGLLAQAARSRRPETVW